MQNLFVLKKTSEPQKQKTTYSDVTAERSHNKPRMKTGKFTNLQRCVDLFYKATRGSLADH